MGDEVGRPPHDRGEEGEGDVAATSRRFIFHGNNSSVRGSYRYPGVVPTRPDASTPAPSAPEDAVDRIVAQWHTQRPDLDPSPMQVFGRLHRIAERLSTQIEATFNEFGLGEGDFDVLASLRRAGDPFTLSPSALAEATMVTTGATSKRIARLQARGLVHRTQCDDDGRGRWISLTPTGLALVDEVVEHHLANERRLLAPLDAGQRDALTALLRHWLLALEPPLDS